MGIASQTVGDRSLITGSKDKWRCGFGSQTELDRAFASGIATGDQVRFEGNSQGSRYAIMSRSSTNKSTISSLKSRDSFTSPTRIGMGLSISQRINGEAFIVEAVPVDDQGNFIGGDAGMFGPYTVLTGAASSGSNVTFKTATDAEFVFDDWVCLYDFTDTRLCVFGRISGVVDPRTFAVTAEQSLGTITWVGGTGKVCKVNLSGTATDSMGFMASGPTTSNAYFFSKSEDSPILCSAYTSFGSSWSVESVPSTQAYSSNKQPRYNTEMMMTMDAVKLNVTNTDSTGNVVMSSRRTQNIPGLEKNYGIRIKSISLPNAMPAIEIVSVTKTGTTTATVVTRTPHGLLTGAYVRAYGSNDSTNFPNVTAETAIAVTNTTTFTMVWGGAATATTYGGIIKPVHAGMVTGIQTASVRCSSWKNGRLWLGLSASTSITVGETVRLQGLATSGGVQSGEGRWKVIAVNPTISSSDATFNSTATVVVSDTDKFAPGQLVTGANVPASAQVSSIGSGQITLSAATTATGPSMTLNLVGLLLEPLDGQTGTNATRMDVRAGGGALVKETDLCLHFIRSLDHTRIPVEVTSGHQHSDNASSVPVFINGGTTSANVTESALISPSTSSITSAATTNATSIKTSAGNIYAMSVNNFGATDVYVKLYNKASAPTVGTDVPRAVIKVPANSDRVVEFGRAGIRYTTGIALAITGAQAVADTTAVAANQVVIDTSYI